MKILWRERKRWFCRLKWTFTVYSCDRERLFIDSGFLRKIHTEVRFYRMLDISYEETLIQRIFKLGTIRILSNDQDEPELEIKNIPNVFKTKENLARLIEEAREKHNVRMGEFMGDDIYG